MANSNGEKRMIVNIPVLNTPYAEKPTGVAAYQKTDAQNVKIVWLAHPFINTETVVKVAPEKSLP